MKMKKKCDNKIKTHFDLFFITITIYQLGGGGGGGGVIQFDCCKVNRELIIVEKVHNTIVSNPFQFVKILLFSYARSRDFDGMKSTGLPVSMYTTQTPIDMCRFNVRSSTYIFF